ncbi:phosphoenolpyruvate--protein phosphotransferase [Caulobacter sp. KR2-114]|uniref:phosphoenolpyruvate--protein phosphotransferase n=1 Tax=Caulobacter sp. KR2-114 TaxID=3400912 RepID=UPI003C0DF25A
MTQTLTLFSPLDGWAAPLAETPDAVFAERMLGDGVAIDPTGALLCAPCDGVVLSVHHTGHAVSVRSVSGVEVLMHIGLETVGLSGEGFEVLAAAGQPVRVGDALVRFDMDIIARRAKSLITPVIVTNGDAFFVSTHVEGRAVRVGDPLMTLTPMSAMAAAEAAAGGEARRQVAVTHGHGLHARPAAVLANAAKGLTAVTHVEFGERRASARSPVAVMSLGVRGGDVVTLSAVGEDAVAAVEVLARVIEDQINAMPAAVAPEPEVPSQPTGAQVVPLTTLKGVRAAPGLAIGAAVRLDEPEIEVSLVASGVTEETEALEAAIAAVRGQIAERARAGSADQRAILDAHLAFLEDPELVEAAREAICRGDSAGVAWRGAMQAHVAVLEGLGDQRLAERADDLKDLERQVLLALSGEAAAERALPDNAILLAEDLLPSQLIGLDAARIAGICLARGGPTSHVAILASTLNIPAVVAAGPRVMAVQDGALLILDGDAGLLQVAPRPAEIEAAQSRLAQARARKRTVQAAAHEAARTADGVRIEVFANVASVAEARAAAATGAEGCGLLRTEFLFLDRQAAPSEDEQAREYQAVAEALAGRPVIVRTLDAGGDKPLAYLPLPPEDNPALGLRGVRVGLWRPDLLKTQLRAILRTAPEGQCRIMLPMVASLSELRAARALADGAAAELGCASRPQVGIMVETPAAAVTADLLAAEADFLSIGTNDLSQYALAMDRTNAELAGQIDALHPAVLRLIGHAAAGGAKHGRMVAVCGALASDLAAVPILIGLGVTELSGAASAVPEIKALVRGLTLPACHDLADRAINQVSAEAVRALTLATDLPLQSGAQP